MGESGQRCVRVRIHGRVQGVFFRAWTQDVARSLGLSGWVRNRRDGTVEALFRGDAAAVREMLQRAHDGPPAARVERIEVEELPCDDATAAAEGFSVLPTV